MEKIKYLQALFLIAFTPFISLCQNNSAQKPDSLNSYELSNVVVTANKFETSIKDVSTKVEVIDAEKIANTNGNRLPEILKTSGSVYIKSYGLTPSLQTLSLNGLGSEHTLILIDGVKLNSFQNAQVDLSLIPKENISRIEIMNNGGSSIYGSEAMGGIINIITNSKPLSNSGKDMQLNASLSSGSFNTNRYSLGLYKQLNNFDARIFYNKEKSDGNYEYYYNNGITKEKKERENAAYSIYDAGLNSQFIIDGFNRIRFISTYSYQDKEVPGIETGTPPPLTKQKDKNWNNILISENIFSPTLSLHTNLNYQNNYMKYEIAPVLQSYYKNLVYAASSELRWKDENFNLISGYNYSHGNLKSDEVEDGAIRNQHALFLSSGFVIADHLGIFPSARYDHISDIKKDVLTYKIGINYQPVSSINLSLKGNAGKNFRAPTFNDLYWKELGNKNLKPENSFNAEGGIFYSFNFFLEGQFEITYTYIFAKDKIVWRPQRNHNWSPENIAESVSKNVSLNWFLRKSISPDVSIRFDAGINFTNSKKTSESYPGDPTTGKYMIYLPLQTVKLGLSFQYDFLGINLFYSHIGKRYSDTQNMNVIDPFNLLDGNITLTAKIWEVTPGIKFEVNNLTNADYETISGYPMPLRNFQLTLFINY